MRIFTLLFVISLHMLPFTNVYSKAIPNNYFGLNAWMPNSIGNSVFNGRLDEAWPQVQASQPKRIRLGGIVVDNEFYTDQQLLDTINNIRLSGAEPIIQVPLAGGLFDANNAASIVTLVNVVNDLHVKHWSIGNEPNFGLTNYSVHDYAIDVKLFSAAMKAIDPSIKIIAGELSYYDEVWVDQLLSGANNIAGQDPATGLDYIDTFSFHTYPFSGNQTITSALASLDTFNNSAKSLKNKVTLINQQITRNKKLTTMVTEFNINWQNPTGDNIYGLGANSFFAAQWVSNMMTIGIKQNLKSMLLWSILEGGDGSLTDIGYLSLTTLQEKPMYYHFQLLAQNFHGKTVNTKSNQSMVNAFSSKKNGKTTVFIMNYGDSNFDASVRLDNQYADTPLAIKVKANLSTQQLLTVDKQSTTLLSFDKSGTLTKTCQYRLHIEASSNLPPLCF